MEKIWQVAERKYDDIIQQLLYNRGVSVDEEAECEAFLNPDFKQDINDPFLIADMGRVVERIAEAKKNNEKIGIFADYDADGIPGAALLYKTLSHIGVDCVVYIPDRESGYGLSREGIDYLVENGSNLIITIDLGIKSVEEAKYAKELGIDLIVTDHHLVGDELPEVFAVLHPDLKNGRYPFKDLCGCGVAYKLVRALSVKFNKIDERFLRWNLDLAAISTIADVVPLTGENRLMAKYGLMVLKKTKNIGLRALYKVAKIETDNINTYTVGFQIAPRINAPGRIDHATKSFELLVTQDENEAMELAEWLNRKNNERQVEMDKVIERSIEQIDKNNLLSEGIIVVSGKWARGIIGPSASRLVDKFHQPAIIIAVDGNEYTGSARSIEGINIVEVLGNFSDYLEKFGGHSGAAGLTIKPDMYDKFITAIRRWCSQNIDKSNLVKKIRVDAKVETLELTKTLCKKIEKFEPFGMGNPKPLFALFGVEVSYSRRVGSNNNHLSFYVNAQNERIKAIYFNCPSDLIPESHTKYDIVFSIGINAWNGEEKVNLNVVDMRESNEKA